MQKMTFEEYRTRVYSGISRPVGWRVGQHAFNLLHEINPELADQVRATPMDPFYRDGKLPKFLVWVGQHWDDKPVAERVHNYVVATLKAIEDLAKLDNKTSDIELYEEGIALEKILKGMI